VFWGCILAGLVTVPLTLGLLHFQSVGQDAERYRVYFSKVGTLSFNAESVVGWVIFHALDIAAVLVLAGVFIFLRRRLRDPGASAAGPPRSSCSRRPSCPCRCGPEAAVGGGRPELSSARRLDNGNVGRSPTDD
jgi:hypothetical protein